jgi:trans-2,3-dihydro-3-hydroxyanthranilate isomerase
VSLPFYLVDAFTREPFAGNAAGVVTRADGLATEQMQRLASELRQTETCFVRELDNPNVDLSLRWFTPSVEVDLCGHATVAAFTCLAAEGRIAWNEGAAHIRCATRTGTIDVWLERNPDAEAAPRVTLSVGVAAIEPAADDRAVVAQALGLPVAAVDKTLPLAAERAGQRLIVPVRRLIDLLQLSPDSSGLVAFGAARGYRRFTLVCRETEDPAHFAHLRHFAPANGIPEDPVTGTAHAVAAVYLDRQGLLPSGDRVVLTGEQGHAVNRRGLVTVDIRREAGCLGDVRIGGTGVMVARGSLAPPGD